MVGRESRGRSHAWKSRECRVCPSHLGGRGQAAVSGASSATPPKSTTTEGWRMVPRHYGKYTGRRGRGAMLHRLADDRSRRGMGDLREEWPCAAPYGQAASVPPPASRITLRKRSPYLSSFAGPTPC